MDLDLKGKVAVITGGSTGIGGAVAEGLAQEGVHLALVARQEDRLMETVTRLTDQYGIQAIGITADVGKADETEGIIAQVKDTYGGADILINNAGTGSNETVMEAPDEKWQEFWELHVMAAVRLARGLAPTMKERGGGVILHNASICATQPLWYEPIYNVTKAALVMFSKCLANELIPFNIRVNAVNPGLVQTKDWINTAKELTAGTETTWEEHLAGIAKEYTPIERFASPEEVANFFVFLCSPKASYMVGSTYYIDGGWLNVIT